MAKKNTPATQPKADIDFEKDPWDAANELRGAVAENHYKDYFLSLLFLKHISERYEIRKGEIRQTFSEPGSDYSNIEQRHQTEVLEDELEYQVKNVYRLPREAARAALPGTEKRNAGQYLPAGRRNRLQGAASRQEG